MLSYFAKPLAFSSSHTFPFTPTIPHTFTRWKPLGSRGMNSPAEVLKYRKSWREPSVLSLAGRCECACTLNNRQSVWGLTWKSGWPNNEWTPTSHAFIKMLSLLLNAFEELWRCTMYNAGRRKLILHVKLSNLSASVFISVHIFSILSVLQPALCPLDLRNIWFSRSYQALCAAVWWFSLSGCVWQGKSMKTWIQTQGDLDFRCE